MQTEAALNVIKRLLADGVYQAGLQLLPRQRAPCGTALLDDAGTEPAFGNDCFSRSAFPSDTSAHGGNALR
jgi:hypothetical protein